jgi:hypothetical protein
MFNIIQYKKPKHDQLFENLSSLYDMTHIQNYIPIYRTIFLLNENNFNKITLNTTISLSSQLNMENIYVFAFATFGHPNDFRQNCFLPDATGWILFFHIHYDRSLSFQMLRGEVTLNFVEDYF